MPPLPNSPRQRPWTTQFSLAGLLIFFTVLAADFAIMKQAPLAGWFLLLVLIPALARTFVSARNRGPEEGELTAGQLAGHFVASFLLLLLAASVGLVVSTALAGIFTLRLPAELTRNTPVPLAATIGGGASAYLATVVLTWPRA